MVNNHNDYTRVNDQVQPQSNPDQGWDRFVGIDIGAETIKIVEVLKRGETLRQGRRLLREHHKNPGKILPSLLQEWDWPGVQGAAVTGRLGRQMHLTRIPTKQAQIKGYRFLFDHHPGTLVSIGSHGFSVLELRANGTEIFRENSRCSQGTGNFLRQLIERFSLTIEEASELCASVEEAAPLSGRCPVILKTDMTHLANKGEDRARILAGLFEAVCENVMVLIKPGKSPSPVRLIGGVSRSPRVQHAFREALAHHDMKFIPPVDEQSLFLEALGCAVIASRRPEGVPALDQLFLPATHARLDRIPPLSQYLYRVKRLPPLPVPKLDTQIHRLILGFDIGSTGSKVIALDIATKELLWQGYLRTGGNPVDAAQQLVRQFVASPAGNQPVVACGVTGSGREIVGSLLSACYGAMGIYVLNEIAAHATGALHYDARVDTIFEIGGQDAKYIRLAEGRIVDCAMNEACSAGTGSFIEEQGGKFAGIKDVVHLSQEALAASEGISLGQHCSVFMAEVIDTSVAAGVDQRTIIAGLYDSIIQNYLNRVKGNRTVGQVIFCQGMPFASDALAAAVARQTGGEVIIPPDPGTVGALGIALLTLREMAQEPSLPLDLQLFLAARIEHKDHFVCRASSGCGLPGNRCRIDRLTTTVNAQTRKFTWGGGCALYDKGTRKKKLPDLAPDPFREQEKLIHKLLACCPAQPGQPSVALADEFLLKGLFPFFATFFHALGFNLKIPAGADQSALKRGIQQANVPYCAPMQLFHGLVSKMVADHADFLFLPLIRSLPRIARELHSTTCPIVQASPDILKWDLGAPLRDRLLSPVIDVGTDNLRSAQFQSACAELAAKLGKINGSWQTAYEKALTVQHDFDRECLNIGRRTLDFCQANKVTPVVIIGRPYTIYNTVLNSNVPAILREQGAIGIPIDCYPVPDSAPVFTDMYWGYGQRILRAARQIRQTPGIYSLYCSNYSCGPDSFNLHFYSYLMGGKPFAIIETDGHSGDAGTKTRVEAFLHCVNQDLQGNHLESAKPWDLINLKSVDFRYLQRRHATLLIPYMGCGSDAIAASIRSLCIPTESLPPPDAEALNLGRRHTSGKECLPMCLTLGNLLKRVQADADDQRQFVVLMPSTHGPCRFGIYNLLNQITLDRLALSDRVRLWSPVDGNYFSDTPPGWAILTYAGIIAADSLHAALLDTRPVEKHAGAANHIYARYHAELLDLLSRQGNAVRSLPNSLWQSVTGDFFGVTRLLRRAAREFAGIKTNTLLPTVLLVGEIYVRNDAFSNDFVIDKLECHSLRVKLAPANEWLEYSDQIGRQTGRQKGLSATVSWTIKNRIQEQFHEIFAECLGWPKRLLIPQALTAAQDYIRSDLHGEAVLTLGGPLHEWRQGHIDAVISVGPLECMPNKIAEAQFFHVSEQDRLPNLTLSLNGDATDPAILDNFAFEVHSRFQQKHPAMPIKPPPLTRIP